MKIFGLNITRAPGKKESPTWVQILSMFPGQPVIYTPIKYEPLMKAGYQLCAAAFSAVSLVARSGAGIRWMVSRRQSDRRLIEIEDHQLRNLLERPNEYDSGYKFIEAVISYKLLAGNSYVQKVGIGQQPPRFLYPLRPDRVEARAGDGKTLIGFYRYTVGADIKDYPVADILHLKDFHPLNDFYGLSRLEVAARYIDIMNWSAEWNLKALQNDMRPPGMVTLKGNFKKEQIKEAEDSFREKYAGAENAAKALFMAIPGGGEIDWKQLSMTPKDMDWQGAEKAVLRRICAIFNVWSGLLGDTESTTYANYQEGRKALYHEAVLPEMDGIKAALNRWLVPLYGDNIVLDYDRDGIEALQEDRQKKYGYLQSSDFMRVNEKRRAVGLEDDPAGDVILVPMGKVPLADVGMTLPSGGGAGTDGNPSPPKSSGTLRRKSFWQTPERKIRLWQSFVKRLNAGEKGFIPAVEKYLRAEAKELKDRITASGSIMGARSLRFSAEDAARAYREDFRSRYIEVFKEAGAAGLGETQGKLWMPAEERSQKDDEPNFDLRHEHLVKLDAQILRAAKFFSETTWKVVQKLIQQAEAEGWTVEELTQHVWQGLGDRVPWEARRIARTELGRTENFGLIEGYKQNEFITMKSWLCSRVPDSRRGHIEADDKYSADPIKLEEAFLVNLYDSKGNLIDTNAMDHPMDDSAPAGQDCNCLCRSMPEVQELGG
jgi:HK97 family phage portal protein